MRTILEWRRPGMARLVHAFEPGAPMALCGGWLRGQAAAQAQPAQADACRECWNKGQARRYRVLA